MRKSYTQCFNVPRTLPVTATRSAFLQVGASSNGDGHVVCAVGIPGLEPGLRSHTGGGSAGVSDAGGWDNAFDPV